MLLVADRCDDGRFLGWNTGLNANIHLAVHDRGRNSAVWNRVWIRAGAGDGGTQNFYLAKRLRKINTGGY